MDPQNNNSGSVQMPQMTPAQKPKKNRSIFYWLMMIVLLGGAFAYIWLLFSDTNNQKDELTKQVLVLKQQLQAANAKLKAANLLEDATCNDVASDELKMNIKAAMDSKNTAAFVGYFSNPVSVIFAASEKSGAETPDQAATDLNYVKDATGPWDFNLPQTTLDSYAAGPYKVYFDNHSYVGKAASGEVIVFNFDCSGKINQVFISPTEEQLIQAPAP